MKKTFLTAVLFILTICLQASVNVIIAYTQNDKASENSATQVADKFKELYPGSTIGKYADMQSIINAFEIKSDTLIFYFTGHSNRIDAPDKADYMGNLLMVLNWNVIDSQNMQDYLLASKSLHYLINKNMSSKKLVILDGCYAYAGFDKRIGVSWLFASDINKGTIITKDYSLFTNLFCKYVQKDVDIQSLQHTINKELLNKDYYPEYNSKLVYSDAYKNERLYPVKSISINNFKF